MRRKLQLAAGVVLGAAALGATMTAQPAAAGTQPAGEFSLRLASEAPATPTGLSFRVVYRDPRDPDGKPPPLRRVALELPAGLILDTGAVPSCEASDGELQAGGRDACPADSRVGAGGLTAITGTPGMDPVETDLTLFNAGDELIELFTFAGTNVTAAIVRLQIEGTRLSSDVAPTPGGPPDGRTTVREAHFTIERIVSGDGGGPRSFITTPPECPASGVWTSHFEFAYDSDAHPQPFRLTDESPCSGPAVASSARIVVPRVQYLRHAARFGLAFACRPPAGGLCHALAAFRGRRLAYGNRAVTAGRWSLGRARLGEALAALAERARRGPVVVNGMLVRGIVLRMYVKAPGAPLTSRLLLLVFR